MVTNEITNIANKVTNTDNRNNTAETR